jgi:hypothetical protein
MVVKNAKGKVIWHVTISNYVNEKIPKVDGMISPITIKEPIGDI